MANEIKYKPNGRPNYYDQKIKPHLADIEKWLSQDNPLTITEICKKLKISKQTFYKYLDSQADLANAVKKRDELNEDIKGEYFKNLKGYYVEESTTEYTFITEEDGTLKEIPFKKVINKKYMKPEASLLIFAMRNVFGWSDRQASENNNIGTSEIADLIVAVTKSAGEPKEKAEL